VLEFFSKLPPCLVGMEACATSHQWARELKKLGHDVRLIPASCVKAYVKRGTNDAADTAAICEAVTRPSMRFVPIKSSEQQSALMLHRTRPPDPATHTAHQRDARPLGRIWPCGSEGTRGLAAAN
jgi:transposase